MISRHASVTGTGTGTRTSAGTGLARLVRSPCRLYQRLAAHGTIVNGVRIVQDQGVCGAMTEAVTLTRLRAKRGAPPRHGTSEGQRRYGTAGAGKAVCL